MNSFDFEIGTGASSSNSASNDMPTATQLDEISSPTRQQSVESTATFNRAYSSLLEAENSAHIDDGKEDGGLFKRQREVIGAYVNHILVKLSIIVLIILDVIFVVLGLALSESAPEAVRVLDTISLVFVIIFLVELCLRIFVELEKFYQSWFNILDGFIIVFSFVISTVLAFIDFMDSYGFGRIIVIGRLIRVVLLVRSIRLLLMTEGFQKSMRLTVGGNKRRYQKDGYDLDLCYITKRIIAMSFPSSGLDGMYRNRIQDVAKFLDEKHPNRYKVYNLCSERAYDHSHFHNRVERFKIDDHNVPTLKEAIRFAKDVKQWKEAHPENVISVHCKGGKGRTGTMICIWLLECGECQNAQEALGKFGDRRTNWDKGNVFQGVETPSQSRFVGYYDIVRNQFGGLLPPLRTLKLSKVIISGLEGVGNSDGSDLSMLIYNTDKKQLASCTFSTNSNCQYKFDRDSNHAIIEQIKCDPLKEEVKFMFYSSNKNVPKYYDDCAFFFSLHTSFIDPKLNRLRLTRNELDNPHKEKFWHIYKEHFTVELFFESLNE